MKCAKDIMSSDVGAVSHTAFLPVLDALSGALHVRHIPVIDSDGRPTGMISLRDILNQLKAENDDLNVPVNKVMSSPAYTAHPDTPVSELAQVMRDMNVSAVLIIEKEELVGIVTERDFLKLF